MKVIRILQQFYHLILKEYYATFQATLNSLRSNLEKFAIFLVFVDVLLKTTESVFENLKVI